MKTVAFQRLDVPVLTNVDAVIAGGSLAGVAAADTLARAGWRVALVEPRTYLGHELSATLRPWLPAGRYEPIEAPLLHAFAATQTAQPLWGELPISLSAYKLFLEDRLLAAGAQLFYASQPIGVAVQEGEAQTTAVRGLVVGNKSGRQLLQCRVLVDAQGGWWTTRDEQQRANGAPQPVVYSRTLEFDGVGAVEWPVLDVPAGLGIVGDRVHFHRGYRGPQHLLVECRLALPAGVTMAHGDALLEGQARRQTMRLATFLLQHVEAFQGATLAAASHELYRLPQPSAPVERGEVKRLQSTELSEKGATSQPLPIAAFGSSLKNFWRLNETVHAALGDPLAGCAAGTQLAHHLLSKPPVHSSSLSGIEDATEPAKLTPGATAIRELESPQPGKYFRRAAAEPQHLPVVAEVDVLVVGGGTSGATAAMVAGRAGLQTALVDMNPGLGGTGTYGGVHSYWFGRRVGFAAQVTGLAVALHEDLRQPPPAGPVPRWNIEAKSQALRQAVEDAGVQLYLNALFMGTVVERQDTKSADEHVPEPALAVRGVALATRRGPLVLLARVIIDATGDGDVAAHAGASTIYGAERDHVVMWYSLAQFARPGRTRNNFTSMVDVSDVQDYTRAILAGRRRLRHGDHDHGIYVAPRESRHICGDVQLTLNDQLLQRRWPDVISVTFSNHDVKGHSTSDWVQLGLIPPNLEIEIPYRALLPQGLDNILVVGKALSATHDALPAIRMQADMENLGGAAALAAAYACRHGCDLREIDVSAVQKELVAAGVLPPAILHRQLRSWRLEGDALERAVTALDTRPLISYADMEMDDVYHDRLLPVDICCAGPQAVTVLEAALARTKNVNGDDADARRLLLSQLLALVDSRAGMPFLLNALEEALSGEELPVRSSHIRYAGAPPDQGAMPQEVYWLHALARIPDHRALPVWQRVVDLLAAATAEDVASGVKGAFYYVEAVCAGAERLGSPQAIPLLRQLHGYEPFHGLVCRERFQTDFFEERRAYLELLIARALARCGSLDGAALLVDYLDDTRALLARHAHSELVAISGNELGRDSGPWAHWLEGQSSDDDGLCPQPYRPMSAPMQVWGQEILIAETVEEAIAGAYQG